MNFRVRVKIDIDVSMWLRKKSYAVTCEYRELKLERRRLQCGNYQCHDKFGSDEFRRTLNLGVALSIITHEPRCK